tara:strand:+ start:366 stop:1043 length:678 start_codon:yes stop_codon:yes gene_type:complete
MKLAITGASGKTGFRIAEEAMKAGYKVKLVIRYNSLIPDSLKSCETIRIDFTNKNALDDALRDSDGLIIATGARPSIDLTGPARIDAIGVKNQVESCKRLGIKRIILVSSLCAGRFFHPLNLFGLILIWKRYGEKAIEESNLDWTIIRPGGLTEKEEGLREEKVFYTDADQQEEASIPRRLVAQSCIQAIKTASASNRIIEITSRKDIDSISMEKAIEAFKIKSS